MRYVDEWIAIAAVAACSLALSGPARSGDVSPTSFVKDNTKVIRKILARRPTKGSKAYQKKKDDLRREVNRLMDFDLLAQRSLKKHWGKLPKEKQDRFVRLLKDLVEESYLSRIDENPDFKLVFKEEKIRRSGRAVVRAVAKKGKSEMDVDFKLMPRNGSWIVYDMVIDDVSIERNYRRQFNKIISKHGFDGLLERMEKKLKELRSGKKASKPGKGDDL